MNTVNTKLIEGLQMVCEEKNSPFALYDGESVETYVPEDSCYVRVSDIDKMIIRQVNTYRILTSTLILQALQSSGVWNVSEAALKNRLRALTDAQYLTKTEFFSAQGISAVRCYSVGYRGRGLLKAMAVSQRLTGYISSLADDITRIKKILSANQFLIRTGVPAERVEVCLTILARGILGAVNDSIFRPQAVIFYDDRTHIVESVRQNEDWERELTKKLGRMASVFRRRDHNVELKSPEVTLIAENMEHMKALMRLVGEERYQFPITFTCDSLTYSQPDNCIYRLNDAKWLGSFFKKVVGF